MKTLFLIILMMFSDLISSQNSAIFNTLDKMHLILIDKKLILLRIGNGELRIGDLRAIALRNGNKDPDHG